jgi:succinylglutamate desuccinylase
MKRWQLRELSSEKLPLLARRSFMLGEPESISEVERYLELSDHDDQLECFGVYCKSYLRSTDSIVE